jgi:hypothetical protein
MDEITGVYWRKSLRRVRHFVAPGPNAALALQAFGDSDGSGEEALDDTLEIVLPRPATGEEQVRPRSTIPLPSSYEPNLAPEDDTVTSFPDVSTDVRPRWTRALVAAGAAGLVLGVVVTGLLWLL